MFAANAVLYRDNKVTTHCSDVIDIVHDVFRYASISRPEFVSQSVTHSLNIRLLVNLKLTTVRASSDSSSTGIYATKHEKERIIKHWALISAKSW